VPAPQRFPHNPQTSPGPGRWSDWGKFRFSSRLTETNRLKRWASFAGDREEPGPRGFAFLRETAKKPPPSPSKHSSRLTPHVPAIHVHPRTLRNWKISHPARAFASGNGVPLAVTFCFFRETAPDGCGEVFTSGVGAHPSLQFSGGGRPRAAPSITVPVRPSYTTAPLENCPVPGRSHQQHWRCPKIARRELPTKLLPANEPAIL